MERIQEMVKCYNGEGDIEMWLRKVKLVAKLKKIDSLANFIPLFLEGSAFSVYDQMSEDDKLEGSKIEKTLLDAFAMNIYSAYDMFRTRMWKDGEAVDSYLADLKKLARRCDIDDDILLKLAFICGLPTSVSCTLRASSRVNQMTLVEVVEQARVLIEESTASACVAAERRQQQPTQQSQQQSKVCMLCKGTHPTYRCRLRKDQLMCWKCGKPGHMIRDCRETISTETINQGNE